MRPQTVAGARRHPLRRAEARRPRRRRLVGRAAATGSDWLGLGRAARAGADWLGHAGIAQPLSSVHCKRARTCRAREQLHM